MKKRTIFNRYTSLIVIMTLIFSLLGVRLSYLQIVNAESYKDKVNNQSIKSIPEAAPRGKIYDRNGVELASNKQSYDLEYMKTDESEAQFFTTFKQVFSYIDSSTKTNDDGTTSKETIYDDFPLKVNPFRFEFTATTDDGKASQELQFKKDIGLGDALRNKYYPKANTNNDLNDSQLKNINSQLMKITPEQVFDYLVFKYDLYKMLGLSDTENKNIVNNEENIFGPKNSKAKNKLNDADITKMLTQKYSLDEIRRYMVIKNKVYLQSFSGYKPVVVASNIEKNTAFLFEQEQSKLPGISVSMQPIRYYPQGSLGSNFIGYISKIGSSNQEKYEEKGYDSSTDYIGMSGLESAYEDKLKGTKGGSIVKVNKEGRATEELFSQDASPGQNLTLTIDANLQKVAEDSLRDTMVELQKNLNYDGHTSSANATRGAVVASDPNTGAILAMASYPSYDPNIFSVPGKLTTSMYNELFNPDYETFAKNYIAKNGLKVTVDDLFPKNADGTRSDKYDIYPKSLFNYATSYPVPPGSTFKPVTSAAALTEGVVTPTENYNSTGIFSKNGFTGYSETYNENGYGAGVENIIHAMMISDNPFFFEMGDRLYNRGGLNLLAKYAWKFGLGSDPTSNAKKGTGLEISEAFGQTYNDTYNRQLQSYYYRFDLSDIFKKGLYQSGGGFTVKFTPLDISSNDNDSDALADAKKVIKDKIAYYINNKSNKVEIYKGLKSDLLPMFNNLIAALPDNQKSKYNSSDAKNMTEAAASYIANDVMTQILSPGNVYNASIGQGTNQFTVVQMANYVATLANGGTRYKAHLVDKITDANGNVVEQTKPEVEDKLNLSAETMSTIKEAMKKVTDEGGTAATVFDNFPIQTAGKTGSATYQGNGVQESVGRSSYGVYIGFAPADNPKIAISVVIFDGGHGGYVAPVAKAMYEEYLKDDILKIKPDYQFKYSSDIKNK
ncbi:penicillin-binding protein [Clostridium sp. 19966]|uniref:penicillin-binding transpeptidase domain-containing protein n=1 Tax=Clostridium sp. 19966 TaxID=2768166 RepID=UPI0028DFCDA0|nr:penicillin-binding transpeptidase domain-containing protein [Clostridium sp. 19966]MDT8715273.1 penicillin-binding protein [Clostridium sp. 19966]